MVQPLWKTAGQFLIKVNIHLPNNPEIPLLRIYPIEMKTYVHTRLVYKCSQQLFR